MSDRKGGSGLLLALLVVLAALAIALITMGSYPVGIALLAVALALLPGAVKAARAGKADDAG